MPQTQLLVDSWFVGCVPAVCLEVPSARQSSSALKRPTGNFAHCLTHDNANRRRCCDLSWKYRKLWALRAIGAQKLLAKQCCMPGLAIAMLTVYAFIFLLTITLQAPTTLQCSSQAVWQDAQTTHNTGRCSNAIKMLQRCDRSQTNPGSCCKPLLICDRPCVAVQPRAVLVVGTESNTLCG